MIATVNRDKSHTLGIHAQRARSVGVRTYRMFLAVVLACAFSFAMPAMTHAQTRAEISIVLPTLTTPPNVSVRGVLADNAFDELMRNGFPMRIHVRAELWRTRTFLDEVVANVDWDIIVQFDSFDSVYEVLRVTGDSVVNLGAYRKLVDARAASELVYNLPSLTPPKGRESYIAVRADVQTIELSDLDELQRWLKGEVRPAVQGKKNPGTAITRGLRSLGSRLLGAEVRHLEKQTKPFKL